MWAAFEQQYVQSTPRLGHPAVLVFPEFSENGHHGSSEFLQARLLHAFPSIHIFSVQYQHKLPWQEQMTRVRDTCLGIQKETEQDQIYFVGHSMGGIIAEIFRTCEAPLYNINIPAILLISSPHYQVAKLRPVALDYKHKMCTDQLQNVYNIGSYENKIVPHTDMDRAHNIVIEDGRHSLLFISQEVCACAETILKKYMLL